jgi:hypothetical protein
MIDAAIANDNVPQVVKDQLLTPALCSGKFLLHIINDILNFSQMHVNQLRLSFTACNIISCSR